MSTFALRWTGKGRCRAGRLVGFAARLPAALTGANSLAFWTCGGSAGWSGGEIERFLRKYGVVVWDRGFVGRSTTSSASSRQANWAEYLLLRRGIPITGSLFNPDNRDYGEQHAPGDAASGLG